MRLHVLVKRLTARLAFVASVLFALGFWPHALIASACEPPGMSQLEDDDDIVDELLLIKQGSRSSQAGARKAPRAAAKAPAWGASLTAPRFVPRQHVERAPPLVLYKPFLRLRC